MTTPCFPDQPAVQAVIPTVTAHPPDARSLATPGRRQAGSEPFFPIGSAAHAGTPIRESAEQSIYRRVRQLHPGLRVHDLNKPVLLAVTRAIEDECCARAQRPFILGSFQRQSFYRAAAARWAHLARSAELTVVFADFEQARLRGGPVAEIPVGAGSPLRREWALVCDASDHPACIIGWELPGQDRCPDQQRIFEALWSTDPPVVRSAARIGAELAAAAIPEIPERLAARLSQEASPAERDLYRATGVLDRMLDYLG